MMDIVAANHVARAGTANVDPIAVTQDLHDVVNLVVFNEIVAAVQIRTNVFRLRILSAILQLHASGSRGPIRVYSAAQKSE